jgi:hypothetical protein
MKLIDAIPHPKALKKLEEVNGEGGGERKHVHSVFHISLANLVKTKNLSKAERVAWRFYRRDSKGRLGLDEVRIDADNSTYHYAGFHHGEYSEDQRAILNHSADRPKLKGYEHAFLRIPEMKVKAVWFQGKKGMPDFFFPIAPRFHGLKCRLYSEKVFLKKLLETAENLLKENPSELDPLAAG